MSKEQEEAKGLIKDVHKSINKPITDKIHEAVVFVKKLVATLFALLIGFLGVIAVFYARTHLHDFNQIAITVSGACAIVDAGWLIWVALMKIGK